MVCCNGLFCVYHVKTLRRVHSHDFNKDVKAMLICKSSAKIFIAFEAKVIAIVNDIEKGYEKDPKFKIACPSAISDIKLAPNELLLAVALEPDPKQNEMAQIDLYSVEADSFEHMCSISNLSTGINFLDFSSDSFYMLYQDSFEETTIIELQTFKKIQGFALEFELEWCADGNKCLDTTKGVQSYFTEDNRCLRLLKVDDKVIIVSDELGSVRIFNYPYLPGSGYGYSRCYSNHLN